MNLARGLRELRSGRAKAEYYRVWHLQQRAGLRYPDDPSPGTIVPFEAALVALGKESGKLEECLRLLADYFAAEDRLVQKVIAKATYPMFVACFATLMIPLRFAIDGRTRLALATFAFGAVALTLAGGTLLLGSLNWYLNKPRFVRGRLLRALTFAIEAGLPLGRAATLAADATGNELVKEHVRKQGRTIHSQPLATTFGGCPIMTKETLAVMDVAEKTGDYDNTLRRMADLIGG